MMCVAWTERAVKISKQTHQPPLGGDLEINSPGRAYRQKLGLESVRDPYNNGSDAE